MSLSKKIAAEVDAKAQPDYFPLKATATEGSNTLTLHLTATASMGVAFDRLEFCSTSHENMTNDSLKAWGDRLSRKLTYLMEPLVVLEVDKEAGEVEIRSSPPTTRDERRTYFEIRLQKQGRLSLQRMSFSEVSRQKTVVPCQLTREALERLADDLVASLP